MTLELKRCKKCGTMKNIPIHRTTCKVCRFGYKKNKYIDELERPV